MFILELTLRSWYHAEENKRRTLQRNDIAAAIMRTDIFDFLVGHHAAMPASGMGRGREECVALCVWHLKEWNES